MSSPLLRSRVAGLSRRTAVLGFAAGALVAGCTTDREPARARGRRGGEADEVAEKDPDVPLAAEAVAGERAALDAVTATVARHTGLAAVLSAVRDAHQAHVHLLDDAAPDAPASASPSASPTGGPTDPFRVPARPRAALRRLAEMEQQVSLANKRHAFAAESGAFARMLASMAASAAQQAFVLGDPATEAGG